MSGQRASMLTAAAVASLSAQDLGLPAAAAAAGCERAGVAACLRAWCLRALVCTQGINTWP